MKTLIKYVMLGFLTLANGATTATTTNFNLESYAQTYRDTRGVYLEAASKLKLATGPYKAARDAYVIATATYTKSLYDRRHLRAEPSKPLKTGSSSHSELILKSTDAKHLKILQDTYWKAGTSEAKFHTAQSIEEFMSKHLE